jgi:hypothetical protein
VAARHQLLNMTKLVLRENSKRGGGQATEWLKGQYTFAVPPYVLCDSTVRDGVLKRSDNTSRMALNLSDVCELSTKIESMLKMALASTLIKDLRYLLT